MSSIRDTADYGNGYIAFWLGYNRLFNPFIGGDQHRFELWLCGWEFGKWISRIERE